jgi:hypothetical protein
MLPRLSAVLVCGILILTLLAGCSSTSGPDDHQPAQISDVSITYPSDDAVIGETVGIVAGSMDRGSVAAIDFYVDGVLCFSDSTSPYQYLWDASGELLASAHQVYAVAYDAAGDSATTDTITVHCRWRELIVDGDDLAGINIRRVCARSTEDMLEFRVETHGAWVDPYVFGDGIDAGIFLDTDCDTLTGMSEASGWFYWPNDIGADYMALLGWEADTLLVWDEGGSWGDGGGYEYVSIENNSSHFEFGIALASLCRPTSIDIVAINLTVGDLDWAPDAGHVRYEVTGDYIGGATPDVRASIPRSAATSDHSRALSTGKKE